MYETNLVKIKAVLDPLLKMDKGLEIPPRAFGVGTCFRSTSIIQVLNFLPKDNLCPVETFLNQVIRNLVAHVS